MTRMSSIFAYDGVASRAGCVAQTIGSAYCRPGGLAYAGELDTKGQG